VKRLRPRTAGSRLVGEDAQLWAAAADRTEPLKKRKGRVHTAAADTVVADESPLPVTAVAKSQAKGRPEKTKTSGSNAANATPLPPPSARVQAGHPIPPPIADFDRRSVKRLRSGRVEIEARVDLHGLRQDEAHAALRTFLYRSQSRDLRWVLVITGKGKAESRNPDSAFAMSDIGVRGVLRRNVPRWLEEPDLRPLIISYAIAAPHHGGEGALYVHLRKRR
jgi:DNA-nicking Smr family endonuclease